MQQRTCSIPDCGRRHDSRGWCYTHYQRWKRHGDPLYVSEAQQLRVGDAETRFLSKVIVLPDGCWRWTSASDGERYGQFKEGGRQSLAHRWAYEHWVGPIPAEQHIDHYRFPQDGCIGSLCVNPDHLRPATPRENTLRTDSPIAWNLAKTHCPYGHPYAGENLEIRKCGARRCRTCSQRDGHIYYQRRKARS